MNDSPVYLGDKDRRELVAREPTLVFSWVAGQRFVFGLSTEEVDDRFGPEDWAEARKLARQNYHASDVFRRNRQRVSVTFIDMD